MLEDEYMSQLKELILKANTPDNLKKPKESINSNYPEKTIKTTDILNRELPLQKTSDVNIDLPQHRNITGVVEIQGDLSESLTRQLPTLTPEHFFYLEGIYRLYHDGKRKFTPTMLYRYAQGDQTVRLTPAKKKHMEKHINDMRTTLVQLDLSSLAKQFEKSFEHLPSLDDARINANLLYMTETTAYVQGVERSVYELVGDDPIILYSLAKRLGHLATFEWNLLEVPKGTSINDGMMNNYLIERIETMGNSKNNVYSRRILLDSLYKYMGKEDATTKQKRTIRNNATHTLDSWIKLERIKSYLVVTEPSSNKIRGFDIEF